MHIGVAPNTKGSVTGVSAQHCTERLGYWAYNQSLHFVACALSGREWCKQLTCGVKDPDCQLMRAVPALLQSVCDVKSKFVVPA